jgi:hypothetical protein
MQRSNTKKFRGRPQSQSRPGSEWKMDPRPVYNSSVGGSGKLDNKILLINRADSSITGLVLHPNGGEVING